MKMRSTTTPYLSAWILMAYLAMLTSAALTVRANRSARTLRAVTRSTVSITGTDGSLYVFEAPIDLLSYISLYLSEWQAHSYVACCGTSIQPVLEQLRRQDIDSVYLCLDNDSAGQKAAQRMEAELSERGIYVEIVVPTLKDWNDDLRREEQEWTQTSGLSL